MPHVLQDRYSRLVDAKLRYELVKKDGVVFNTRYEGDPKAGVVKVPVRDTEVTVANYDKAAGVAATMGSTAYFSLEINKDKSVNEIIDGFDAAAVPDNLVADRLDSATYSLALQMDTDATTVLEGAATSAGTGTLTKTNIYETIVDARTALSVAKVPNDNRRFLLVPPATMALILKSPEFISASDLGDEVKQNGIVGRIANFNVIEDATLSANTNFIAGHPDWCARVSEWQVAVHVQDINGSGKYIGASAVQGRKVYGMAVTKPATLLIHTKA